MIVGHEQAEAVLARAVQQDRVNHAYLFAGPESVGKHTAALLLAQAVNCERRDDRAGTSNLQFAIDRLRPPVAPSPRLVACGVCDSCRRIAAGTHPDVHVILPGSKGGQNISVEQIRDLRQDVARRPIMGRRKLYLVPSAEAMNEEAANTLLKTLEEPPPNVTLVLMAPSPTRVLPTIRSRCQVVRFGLVKSSAIRDWLTELGIPPATAEAVALTAGGRPGLALRWSREPEALTRRRQVLELMAEVAGARERSLRSAAEGVVALRLAERARALVGSDEGSAAAAGSAPGERPRPRQRRGDKGEASAQGPGADGSAVTITPTSNEEPESAARAPAKPHFLRLLEVVRSYYRDLLLLVQGAPEEIVANADTLPGLREASGLYTAAELVAALAAVNRCQQFLERNVQPQLALETLFLELTATNSAPAR